MTGGSGKNLGGHFDDKAYKLPIRVYYEDTDFSGVVYHANYLKFAERGRSDFLRAAGVHHTDMLALTPPLAFVVTAMNIKFFAPARIDDELTVVTVFTAAKGARMLAYQAVWRDDDIVWQAEVQAACVDLDGRPRRMPREVADKLALCLSDTPPEGFVTSHEIGQEA